MQQRMISSLFSFLAAPVGAPAAAMAESDLAFIDELCRQTHDLPTMEAAIERLPRLADIPIRPVYREDGNFGSYRAETGVEINMTLDGSESRPQRFEAQLTTLPHELRHGYQDLSGCLKVCDDPRFKRDIETMILCDRVVEADATAFSLAVMYELYLFKDDPQPLNAAHRVHPGSVDAYWRATGRDENAHWNGKAAQAAFHAYFRSDNGQRLRDYDIKLCEEFFRSAAEDEESCEVPRPLPERARSRLFWDYMRPIASMPYISRRGKWSSAKPIVRSVATGS